MTKSRLDGYAARLNSFFASPKFFYAVMIFLIISSLWVAVSSLYPMAFDEEFHLGLIKIYAQSWSPFAVTQTPDAAVFGSIETDPSYLFHYLMSFPYRLLTVLTSSQTAIVIGLRILNVALFAYAVVLYRKVLLRTHLSPAAVHTVLAVFVLIPIVPLLAGQINYDNLLILIVAVVFLLAMNIRESLSAKNQLPIKSAITLVTLLLFASIVKYAFLPIAAGVVIYLIYEIIRARKRSKQLFKKVWTDIRRLPVPLLGIFIVTFLVATVLFAERYATNIIRYHDPVPDCGVVLEVESCIQYGPWGRDYKLAQSKSDDKSIHGPVGYTTKEWLWGMWRRLFFTLAGPTNGYDTQKQLPIPSISAIILFGGGVLLALVYGRSLLRQYPIFVLFIIVSTLYIAALWLQVYQLYVYTARPVAINGRYLVPLLPAIGAILAVAYSRFFSGIGRPGLKGGFVVVALLLLLQGGGPVTYIVKSQPNWYWQNSFIQNTSNDLRHVLKPVIIGD